MRIMSESAKKRAVPRIARRSRYLPETVLTIAAERRLSRKFEAIRNGTAKIISSEEMRRRIALEMAN